MSEQNTQEKQATNDKASTETHHESNDKSSGKLEKIVAFMAFGLGAIAVNAMLPKKFKLESDDLADLISKFSLMDFCQKDNEAQSLYEEIEKRAKEVKKNKI
jgi:mannitol-specific phosphotransferase system IIBC component